MTAEKFISLAPKTEMENTQKKSERTKGRERERVTALN